MRQIIRWCLGVSVYLAGLAVAAPMAGGPAPLPVHGDWSEVRERVADAIAERGFVVAHVNKIGEMLDRTGKDIGDSRRIYAHAEAIEFCSASLSRRMMEADPHNIVFCPYTIYVYSLAGQPKTVYLAYRKPDGGRSLRARQALDAVEQMLASILTEAAQAK